jgi:hypothetical protein
MSHVASKMTPLQWEKRLREVQNDLMHTTTSNHKYKDRDKLALKCYIAWMKAKQFQNVEKAQI